MKWPGERDSNPWRLAPQRFSRPPLSTTQPSPENYQTSDKSFAKALLEVILGFEPRIKALQAHALPLGYITLWCPGPDLNRHGKNYRGILSPLRLPFPPPGQNI